MHSSVRAINARVKKPSPCHPAKEDEILNPETYRSAFLKRFFDSFLSFLTITSLYKIKNENTLKLVFYDFKGISIFGINFGNI